MESSCVCTLRISCSVLPEKMLEIEYIKAIALRRQQDPSLHNAWVISADGSKPRLWKDGAECTHILAGHAGVITSAVVFNGKGDSENTFHIATGSKDRSLWLWKAQLPINFEVLNIQRNQSISQNLKFYKGTHHQFRASPQTLG